MKSIVFLTLCFAAVLALPSVQLSEKDTIAEKCTDEVCKLADNCRCASPVFPLRTYGEVPQLISLTFDEALTDRLFYDYWEPLLHGKVNPDGKRISATFFVPHEYTDYQRVNDLYQRGYEIAVHSVTNSPLQAYWRGASEQLLEQEFGGQKRILSRFANIRPEDLIGVRTPQLQYAGNATIEAYVKAGFSYDSSWPTLNTKPLFPYTLDYLSTQQCTLGNVCPNESFKGFWILPIVDLMADGTECNNLSSCGVSGTSDEIAAWLVNEIEKIRQGTKVPITLIVTSHWFLNNNASFEGLNMALEKITTYGDTFFVSQKQVLDWMRNPVNITQFETEMSERDAVCHKHACALLKGGKGTERYMSACAPCPELYPWVDNPDGDVL